MISNLSQRERIALVIGGVAVLATLVWVAVISPYQQSLDRLDTKIAARERQVRKVQELRNEYLVLQRQLNDADSQLTAGKDFSLFSFVENLITQVASKENLVYMRPQPVSVQNGLRENSVEIKVEKIRLDQLVRMLYAIDSAKAYLKVKNARIKTRFDDRSLIDAVLTISSFGKST
jgi:general secretion pathway protein M